MLAYADPIHPVAAPCPPRTVALVGRYAHQHLQDAMLTVADCDVVFVESAAHAYSKIKRVLPDVVIVCLSGDEADGCQVLSMLALDRDTAHIPVLTFVMPPSDDANAAAVADAFDYRGSASLN